MCEDFSKFQKYILKNVELAGRKMLGHQRDYMRKLYVASKSAKTIEEIISILDEYYDKLPYEKSLKKDWPSPKWAIRWIYQKSASFSDDPIDDDYFYGFPFLGDDGSCNNEQDERDIEKGLFYV